MDDPQMGTSTDETHDGWMDGDSLRFHVGDLLPFLPMITGIFNGFSADSDEVMDGLPDGSTDKSDDSQMERKFSGFCDSGNFIQHTHRYFHHEFS